MLSPGLPFQWSVQCLGEVVHVGVLQSQFQFQILWTSLGVRKERLVFIVSLIRACWPQQVTSLPLTLGKKDYRLVAFVYQTGDRDD